MIYPIFLKLLLQVCMDFQTLAKLGVCQNCLSVKHNNVLITSLTLEKIKLLTKQSNYAWLVLCTSNVIIVSSRWPPYWLFQHRVRHSTKSKKHKLKLFWLNYCTYMIGTVVDVVNQAHTCIQS